MGSMVESNVVPDVINEEPEGKIEIKYLGGNVVNDGNKLTPTIVKDVPYVTWNAEEDVLYTLCMVDPDAPSRNSPKFREWLHWLVVNIPENNIATGQTICAYVGAGPPKGTGFHRYVFLLYQQPSGKINCCEKRLPDSSAKGRTKFSIKKFAAKYKLGSPVAGNFFEAEYDDYVPKLYKQLGK